MRAVLIATGNAFPPDPFRDHLPAPLVPLVDKPFIQHVVECLVGQGYDRFDVVLHHRADQIEAFLGNGRRWGCSFTYHVARNPRRPYGLVRIMSFDERTREPVLLANAERMPQVSLKDSVREHGCKLPVLIYHDREGGGRRRPSRRWTGWALLSAESLNLLPGDLDEAGLEEHLATLVAGEPVQVATERLLTVHSTGRILSAHQAVLRGEFPDLLLPGHVVRPGVRCPHRHDLRPSVRVRPPVYVGENCRVGSGVELGPHAFVSRDCVLEDGCKVSHAVVFSGTYVGEAVELSHVLAAGNVLVPAHLETPVTVADPVVLGNLYEHPLARRLGELTVRALAGILLLAAAPVLLLTALYVRVFRRGPVLYRKEVLRVPVDPDEKPGECFPLWSFDPGWAEERPGGLTSPAGWRSLLLETVPGLLAVVRGELSFCGVPPRSRQEMRQLSPEWRSYCRRAKAGLITEAALLAQIQPVEEERFAADAFYAVNQGWRYDLKLLGRYLARLFGKRS